MGKAGRELLRGRPLSADCCRANCSGVEYTENGVDYYGCYGLMDWPENYNDECKKCGAFVDNLTWNRRATDDLQRERDNHME